MGHATMRHFIRTLNKSDVQLESIQKSDLLRVSEILDTYADSKLDFVDATIVAISERLNISQILTLDRRDFSIIRPKHCAHFDILPW